jgi:hypothetical protein
MQRAISLAIELERRRRKPPSAKAFAKANPFRPNPAEACELKTLARRVERLCPSHRSPERFHEDKSQIVFEMRRIAARVRR